MPLIMQKRLTELVRFFFASSSLEFFLGSGDKLRPPESFRCAKRESRARRGRFEVRHRNAHPISISKVTLQYGKVPGLGAKLIFHGFFCDGSRL
jgi:hypothetical protein